MEKQQKQSVSAGDVFDIGELGKRIKALRVDRGWSLRQFGSATNMSHAHLAQIEAGQVPEPSIVKIAAIAAALDILLDKLIADSGSTDPELSGKHNARSKAKVSRVEKRVHALHTKLLFIASISPQDFSALEAVIGAVQQRHSMQDDAKDLSKETLREP